MPLRRRLRFRRRRTFRRTFRSFRPTFRKRVRRVLFQTSELKQTVSTLGTELVSDITSNAFITSIPQGPGDNQRIGNQIRARNFQAKFNLDLSATTGNEDDMKYVRVYIVWPRKLSSNDAANLITTANFPLQGMPDQDNWIYWYDKTFRMQMNAVNGTTKGVRVVFNKRFYPKLEFTNSGAVIPNKIPFVIWVWNSNAIDFSLNLAGFLKVTYKDI